MSKNLVIVESPAKAKTIEKFLGPDYIVKSSIGHIRDMPKKDMGIDLNNNFLPTYEISSDKKKVVSDLKKSVKVAEKVASIIPSVGVETELAVINHVPPK